MSYNTYEKPAEIRIEKKENEAINEAVDENKELDEFLEKLKSINTESLRKRIELSFKDQTSSFVLSKDFK